MSHPVTQEEINELNSWINSTQYLKTCILINCVEHSHPAAVAQRDKIVKILLDTQEQFSVSGITKESNGTYSYSIRTPPNGMFAARLIESDLCAVYRSTSCCHMWQREIY